MCIVGCLCVSFAGVYVILVMVVDFMGMLVALMVEVFLLVVVMLALIW